MAVLSDADRAATWAAMMRDLSVAAESCGITKAQLRAALDAADSWADSNAAAFNTALPAAARNGLTSTQKARLLLAVVRRRWEVA